MQLHQLCPQSLHTVTHLAEPRITIHQHRLGQCVPHQRQLTQQRLHTPHPHIDAPRRSTPRHTKISKNRQRFSIKYILISVEQRDAAVRTYFKSMVAYRVSRLTSRLATIQNELLEKSETMDIRQMDADLNFLEDLRRLLEDFKG